MTRARFSIRTLLLVIITILNLLIAGPLGFMAYKSYANYQNAQDIKNVTETLYHLYNTKKYLSLERAAALSISYVPADSAKALNGEIQKSRDLSQQMIEGAFGRLEKEKIPEIEAIINKIKRSYTELDVLRLKIDAVAFAPNKAESPLPDEIFHKITALIKDTDQLIETYSQTIIFINPEVARQMRLTRMIWEIGEYAGQEYAILGKLIAQNKFPDIETRERLIDLRGRIKYGLELAQGAIINSSSRDSMYPALDEARTHYLMIFEQIKDVFYQPTTVPVATLYPVTVEMWLQLASEAVSSLHEMTDAVLQVNALYVQRIQSDASRSISVSLFLFISALALSFYTWWLITTRIVNPVNSMVEALYKETKLSDQKIQKNENLDEITKLDHILQVFRENSHQLEKERDRAQAANIAKSEFLANMSHEIRTPMNVVVGLSSILARTSPLSDKQAEFIRTLQISADSLLSLINDLLDFSKIEAKSFELEQVRFNLGKLIEDLATVKTFKAKQKDLSFEVKLEEIEGKEYIGDPTRIRQILVNLCGNAIKFTEDGTVSLRVISHPHAQKGYETIEIVVADTGIGIPEEKLDSIFEKFTQADASVVRKYGGTGLGLAITKNFVEMMNGEIRVKSVYGEGATFRVLLPLKVKAAQKSLAQSDIDGDEEKSARGKILLVEDYYPNIVVAGTLLEEFGYEYDVAENGQQAVQKYMENDYDAVLMDVQMPGMDGYQATKAIREYEKEKGALRVKIIGLTAHASTHDRERCLAAGMDDYLPKPFEQRILKEKLRRA